MSDVITAIQIIHCYDSNNCGKEDPGNVGTRQLLRICTYVDPADMMLLIYVRRRRNGYNRPTPVRG